MALTPKTFRLEIEVEGMADLVDEILRLQVRLSELEARLARIDPEGEGV